jgi:hypothetical protein
MSSRFSWFIPALCAFFIAACAEGAPAAPPGQMAANPLLGQTPAVCGDGMWDKKAGEQCDCPKTTSTMCMAPSDTTCETLGMGTGPVYCLAGQCTFVTSACSAQMNSNAGNGAAGRSP